MRRRIAATLAAVSIALAGFMSAGPAAYSDERSDLVEKQEQAEKDIERIQSELEGVDVDLQDAYLNLEKTRGQIPKAEAELAEAEDELAAAQREAEANAALLAAAQEELDTIDAELTETATEAEETRKSLGELARATYRGESMPSTLDILVGSESAEDFLQTYRANSTVARTQTSALTELEQTAAQNENRKARQTAVEEEVTRLKEEADALVVVKEGARTKAEEKKQSLEALEKQYAEQSKELEKRKSDFKKSLSSAQAVQESTQKRIIEIDSEIRRKAEEERKRKAAEAARRAAEEQRRAEAAAKARGQKAPAAPAPAPRSAPRVTNSASWIIPPVPAPVYVTSPFGMRNYPFGGRWMHNGVDLRSRCGEAQVAAADGVVAYTVPAAGNGTHGNQVFINHGMVGGSSYITVTNHLSAFNVRPGQSVKKGDVIGWTGQTGKVTGCHVHFEVWQNGQVINPMSFGSFTQRFG